MNQLAQQADSIDRRAYRRLHCRIPMSINSGNNNVLGVAINMSISGAFIELDESLKFDKSIYSSFELPYTLAKMELQVKIVRQEENPSGLAVRFENLTDDSRRVLGQYIRDFA